MNVAAMVPVIAVSCGALGYVIGRLHERVEWDKLIRNGRLPRPGYKWR